MRIKVAISVLLIFGMAVLGHAYVRGYPPFTSQFVQTCDRAIKERLVVPSTYKRISVDEFGRQLHSTSSSRTHYELRPKQLGMPSSKSHECCRFSMSRSSTIKLKTPVGAIIRERATCTFNSLMGAICLHVHIGCRSTANITWRGLQGSRMPPLSCGVWNYNRWSAAGPKAMFTMTSESQTLRSKRTWWRRDQIDENDPK